MKFQELEARATPGTISVHHCQDRLVLRTGPSRPVRAHRYIATMTCGDFGRDDALLLAHCRNNFGKALEALREIADMIQYETSFESPAYKRTWEIVAELEDVQT